MLAVHFMPGEPRPGITQGVVDQLSAFAWNVRVLTAPDHQQFAMNILDAVKGIIMCSLPQAALVNIGGIKADAREHIGIHGGAKREMSSDANADGAQLACAVASILEIVQHRASIGIVGRQFLGDFQFIAPIGPGLIVGKGDARRFKLMVNFRNSHDKAMARKECRRPLNGAGDLENFGKEQEVRDTFRRRWGESHASAWGRWEWTIQ